jgi:hypothetical protein
MVLKEEQLKELEEVLQESGPLSIAVAVTGP